MTGSRKHVCLHATCIALDQRGLLIQGASGSGKSALALHLMALGALLVADDRVNISLEDDSLVASAPEPLRGFIEARGIGLLKVEPCAQVEICAVVDMDADESERLPYQHEVSILGKPVTLLRRVDAAHFAPALLQYLKCGRRIS